MEELPPPMRLKNLNESPHNGFTFHFRNEVAQQNDMVTGNSLDNLESKVTAQFRNLKMAVPENLRQIIEHQICLRQPNPANSCWSGGLGDDLHHKWIKPFLTRVADKLDAFPTPFRGVNERPKGGIISRAAKAIAKTARRVSTCGSCGGTRVYEQGANNLGRAGQINQVVGPTHR